MLYISFDIPKLDALPGEHLEWADIVAQMPMTAADVMDAEADLKMRVNRNYEGLYTRAAAVPNNTAVRKMQIDRSDPMSDREHSCILDLTNHAIYIGKSTAAGWGWLTCVRIMCTSNMLMTWLAGRIMFARFLHLLPNMVHKISDHRMHSYCLQQQCCAVRWFMSTFVRS
jgi:hypothetical protein